MLRLEVETKNLDARETMYEMKKLKELSSELFPSARLNITGGLPEYAILNQLVAKGQIKSLLLALAIIGILMIIVFGSVKTGLVGLIPNILPILVIGGTMGLFKIPLDFLTVTIAPMILGIAVDNTIHFINHLKQKYKQVGDYSKASVDTLKVVGQALFTTSFIIIISFIIYLTSPLNMMVYLGLFVVIGIFSAMVSNLLLTPIIMKWTKPFGK
jgi:predicted RND superfamily exporter protein